VYYPDLQAGLQSRQGQSLLSRSQLLTDTFTSGGLPTYYNLQSTNGQPMSTHIDNSIQQPNVTLFPQSTHQQWLSQDQHSEQSMQSEHEQARQNSMQDILEVFPIEPSDYAQSQVCLLLL